MTNATKMVYLGVCLCFLLYPHVRAQDYLPIVKENAEWTVLKLTINTQNPIPSYPRDTFSDSASNNARNSSKVTKLRLGN
jgi:hypothetical protein